MIFAFLLGVVVVLGVWLAMRQFESKRFDESVEHPGLSFGINGCTYDVTRSPEISCLIRWRPAGEESNKRELTLAVSTVPNVEIALKEERSGVRSLFDSSLSRPVRTSPVGEAVIRGKVNPQTQSLLLTARDKKKNQIIGWVRVRVRWMPLPELDWRVLYQAENYKDPLQQQAILRELESALASATDDEQRLRMLLHLVSLRSIYLESARADTAQIFTASQSELRRVLLEALELCKKLRRLHSEAMILSNLAYLALDAPAERPKVEREILGAIESLGVLPVDQSLLYGYLGELAMRRNDLSAARDSLSIAVKTALWIENRAGADRKNDRLYRVRFALGEDVNAELDKSETQARENQNVCEMMQSLHHIAWIRLLLWESTPLATRDPLPLFEEIIQRTQGPQAPCRDAVLAQYALASRARRLSLPEPASSNRALPIGIDWEARAKKSIELARQLSKPVPQNIEFDLQLAEARLAVYRKDAKTASELFEQLDAQTERDAMFEDRWEAFCGGAVVQMLADPAKPAAQPNRVERKRQKLQECGQLLEELIRKVPLDTQASALESRNQMLGRALGMLRIGDNKELLPTQLEIVRHAVHRLTAYWRWPVADGTSSRRAEIEAKIIGYREQRERFEEWLRNNWTRLHPDRDTPMAQQERVKQRREQLHLLEEIFRDVNQDPELGAKGQSLPDIPPDDLLLICYPEGDNAYCITKLDAELRSVVITKKQKENKAELAELLFGAWRSKLPPAEGGAAAPGAIRHLRVLADGWLRDLDLAGLPIEGRPLDERLPIFYSLDITAVPQPRRVARAMLAIHPTGDLGGADETIAMLGKNLLVQRLNPLFLSVDLKRPVALPIDREPYFKKFYSAQNSASLLVLLGHLRPSLCSRDPSPFEAGKQSSWLTSICLASYNALWPGDVLLAPQVPDVVLLLGCSADTQEKAASTVSMASAYVLRGSRQVLGTVRDIPRPVAQQLLCYLSNEPDFGSDTFDLPFAMQRALIAFRAGRSCPGGVPAVELAGADLTAFRVYAP